MLALEPILILVTIYLSVVYALLYATFSVFRAALFRYGDQLNRAALIWEEGQGLRDLNAGETGLIFIGVGLGAILGGITNVFLSRPFRHLTPKWRGTPPPEYRLYGAMLAGPSLAIGLFWLGASRRDLGSADREQDGRAPSPRCRGMSRRWRPFRSATASPSSSSHSCRF